ncbi:MAG: outer membrane beta-barrel protein [Gammaproteobacteria bacterium]|nr:outer membrane beta-barrel protein [Gammaproteobacteria bacterium]
MNTVSRKRHILGALIALGLAAGAMPAHAVQKGDWLIRAGLGRVAPDDSSSGFSGAPTLKVEDVSNSTNLAINFTYMMTDNVGVELLGALPFKHDIAVTGLGKVVETKQLPPTLILLYNFSPKSGVRPYAGAGINYTKFFGEKTVNGLTGTSIELSSSTGLALEAGIDVDINKEWYVNASVWKIDIDTKAKSSLVGTADVSIDPTVLFMGVGRRF